MSQTQTSPKTCDVRQTRLQNTGVAAIYPPNTQYSTLIRWAVKMNQTQRSLWEKTALTGWLPEFRAFAIVEVARISGIAVWQESSARDGEKLRGNDAL